MGQNKPEVAGAILGVCCAFAGAALFLAPMRMTSAANDDRAKRDIVLKQPSSTMHSPAVQSLWARFDLSSLPPPRAMTPGDLAPENEAERRLMGYIYIGSAVSSDRGHALFRNGDEVVGLSSGESLEGFALVSFNSKAASFEKEGDGAVIILGMAPSE